MIIQKFVKKISKKKRVVLGVVGALVFVIAVIVFTGISIYVLKWENCFFTNGIARVIPYPAMRVNGDFIRFSDYQKDISTLVKFYAYEADVAGLPVPKYETIRINILERLKRNKIIEQVAEREGIVITKEELDAEFYKIMVRAGSPETVEDTLKNFYGWNEKEFKKRIVWSVLLQEKLKIVLGVNENLDSMIDDELAVADIKMYIK